MPNQAPRIISVVALVFLTLVGCNKSSDDQHAQKVADRVIFLHEGKKVFDGPPAEMKSSEIDIVREFMHLDSFELLESIPRPEERPGA